MKKQNLIQRILGINKPYKAPVNSYIEGRTVSFAAQGFDGEKNLGEMGRPKDYVLNHEILRIRSWQSYTESEITQTLVNKFTSWIVGSGLVLQSDPVLATLKSEGIDIENVEESFNEVVEHRFGVWANSTYCDYASQKNLGKLAKSAFINSKLGGDVLVILRVVDNCVKIQLVDGGNIKSPTYGSDVYPLQLENGNVIRNGVEMSPTGEHIRYHVQLRDLSFTTVPAYVGGVRMAYLVYGSEYRLDNSRGFPLFAVVLETVKKLERYKEAAVGSAEERAKIPYFIKHEIESDGSNPFLSSFSQALNGSAHKSEQLPEDVFGNKLADKIAVTTKKQVFNMPNGSELKAIDVQNEMYFKDFYSVNIDLICSSIMVPPEVALSKYNSNFSASRAALKDWEHIIKIGRKDFSDQFYQPIYNLFLHLNVMLGKVDAPGYLEGFLTDNFYVLEGYRTARFAGPTIPHIDPLKEVNAVRAKLGDKFKGVPLTTFEDAVAELNGGNSDATMRQVAEEYKEALRLGIVDKLEPAVPEKKPKKEN